MGVLTRLYAVPAPLMKKIRADNEKLGFLFGYEQAEDDSWRVPFYDFGKNFEDPADDEPEYGKPILEGDFEGLVGDVEKIKKFFATAAAAGHFVIASAS